MSFENQAPSAGINKAPSVPAIDGKQFNLVIKTGVDTTLADVVARAAEIGEVQSVSFYPSYARDEIPY